MRIPKAKGARPKDRDTSTFFDHAAYQEILAQKRAGIRTSNAAHHQNPRPKTGKQPKPR